VSHAALFPFLEANQLPRTEQAVRKAELVTRLLYESDYGAIKTEDVLTALEDDPRLKQCPRGELLGAPVVKLTAAYGLVSSNGKIDFGQLSL
jgi:tyrosyl-tRNA synthetase